MDSKLQFIPFLKNNFIVLLWLLTQVVYFRWMDKQQIFNYIEKHFKSEQNKALLLILLGLSGIGLGLAGFYYFQSRVFIGASAPLLILGPLHLFLGTKLLMKSLKLSKLLPNKINQNPNLAITKEIKRLEKEQKVQTKKVKVDMALFLLGFIFLIVGFFQTDINFITGNGAGLMAISGPSYLLNLLADIRHSFYHSRLEKFLKQI